VLISFFPSETGESDCTTQLIEGSLRGGSWRSAVFRIAALAPGRRPGMHRRAGDVRFPAGLMGLLAALDSCWIKIT